MANSLELESLVNKLISTYLLKGIQPDDLATALFEEEYEEFLITKNRTTDVLVVKLSFFEINDEDISTLHKFRYTYEMSTKRLIKIEQSIGAGKFKTQWDRSIVIQELMSSIGNLISPEDFKKMYLDNLPKDVSSKLYLVA
ncbi:hypothetical protein ACG93R_11920 [Acinetobacter guillouiae]|uniref:hypothetical protein n=1 Tax=Acinetobacter guillouiae TaxID=106649 RepID=UPI003AF66013